LADSGSLAAESELTSVKLKRLAAELD